MNAIPLIATESLENRRLFSIALNAGTLTIEGTDGNDIISIIARNSTLTVRAGADRMVFLANEVDEVTVNALGGNDRVTLGRLNVSAAVDGGAGDDRISGGRANDILAGGDGDDRISGSDGDDELLGDAGSDRLFGGNGDDDLDGGAGIDLLNGGAGFDSTTSGADLTSSIENGGNGNVNNPSDDSDAIVGIRPSGGLLRSPFAPVDTTGFNVSPGNNVISPVLSSNPAGNAVYFNSFSGVTIQAGGAQVTLSNTGAFGRELGLAHGIPGVAIKPGD